MKFLNWSKAALAGLMSTTSPGSAASAAAFTAEAKSGQSTISGLSPGQRSTAARIFGPVAPFRNSFFTWAQIYGPRGS